MITDSPTVIVDTREQTPYSFPSDWVLLRKALPTGDYTLLGHEGSFVIERKSLSDLLGCIFTPRFKRELERLQSFTKAYLVIEANLWKIHHNPFYKGNPNAVQGMLQKISLAYGVEVLFLDDRETAETYVQGVLSKYYYLSKKEGE